MIDQEIVIVSGIPRSGTSMMMQALVAGGLKAVTDQQRVPDSDNPIGYLELEAVKQLPRGNDSFLNGAQGKVIKIIHALLPYLPSRYRYRVVFVHRDLCEVVASQKVMLTRNSQDGARLPDNQLIAALEMQRNKALAWLKSQDHCETLETQQAAVIAEPMAHMQRVNTFLGGHLDVAAMAGAVNPALRHHKRHSF